MGQMDTGLAIAPPSREHCGSIEWTNMRLRLMAYTMLVEDCEPLAVP
jgi:hypothetical protein